jgi:hypothetical protein
MTERRCRRCEVEERLNGGVRYARFRQLDMRDQEVVEGTLFVFTAAVDGGATIEATVRRNPACALSLDDAKNVVAQ